MDKSDSEGWTPLTCACVHGSEKMARLLLKKGASIDLARNITGSTPLYIACEKGHESTARLLLDKGASVDLARNDGATPLFMA